MTMTSDETNLARHCEVAQESLEPTSLAQPAGELRLHVLSTGSKGNATVVETPAGLILVDCGISCRQLLARMATLGLDPSRLLAILVTHEHSDHIAGLRVTAGKLRVPVYASSGTARVGAWPREVTPEVLDARRSLLIGDTRVTPFHVPHDAAETLGFRFELGDESIGLATDIGSVTDEAGSYLADASILAIESNHDVVMLRDYPNYPSYLKARIASDHGHLSNEQAARALSSLVTSATRCVIGMHMSQHTNLPSLCRSALEGGCMSLESHAVKLLVGSQTTPISA